MNLQSLIWIPKLAVHGLVSQTDGLNVLQYGGSQITFGKCQGFVESFDMIAIQVLYLLSVKNLCYNESLSV